MSGKSGCAQRERRRRSTNQRTEKQHHTSYRAKDKERKGAIHLGGCCTTTQAAAVCVNSPMAARAVGKHKRRQEKYIYVDKVEFIIFQLLNMT